MNIWLGFFFVLVGAICGGSFGLPSKFVKKDTPWENLWGPFFLLVTVLIPTTLGPLLVRDFFGIYGALEARVLVPVLIFGLLWGLGSMTLGMSFAFIGLSLAYALNYGAQIAFGSMVPMILFDSGQILTSHGYVILAGVAVCLAGVVVSGRAGILKDRSLKKEGAGPADQPPSGAKQPKIAVGLIIAIVSGILCACYAVAARFGAPVKAEAAAVPNAQWACAWAVMALILWGGAVSSCLYCVVLLTKNKTWKNFRKPGVRSILLLALAMALLHDGAIFFFGLGYINLGRLGISVGYAAFMSFAIIVGNVHGFRTGEWKGASRQSIQWLVAGIAALILGVCVLAAGNAMQQRAEEKACTARLRLGGQPTAALKLR